MSDQETPAATTSVQNWYQSEANALYSLAIVAGVMFPGALIGALVAGAVWHATREPNGRRLIVAAFGILTAFTMHSLVVGWTWRFLIAAVTSAPAPLAPSTLIPIVGAEVLLGPALLFTFQVAETFRSRTALGQLNHEHKLMTKRAKALRPGYQGPSSSPQTAGDWGHPPGKIRLGLDENRRVFDLNINEITQHVFVPGATGTGKTTTLMRLASGAVANGYGVVIIDCKGVGLAPDAEGLAARSNLPYNVVDPHEDDSLGYDTCAGDPAHVANKLVGAFSYSADADIYKNVALEVVPLIARGLISSGQPVTLRGIYNALARGGLAKLGRMVEDETLSERLRALETTGGVGASGYAGLQRRLGALLEGRFGLLFEKTPALDWSSITNGPSVTYFSLSATATSEDVELFGRVITQDLKQLCDTRLRSLRRHEPLTPLMVIYDEFAALREANQIVDLLLQARQAQISVIVATQFLPEEPTIRTPALQAGVLICHQVAADDAEAIAAEIGTRNVPKPTAQLDLESGESEKASIRMTKEYRIHPDIIKELPTGATALYARRSRRRDIVRIHLDQP